MKSQYRLLTVCVCLCLCACLRAGEGTKFDLAAELANVQADQLAQFATQIQAKAGSWENETRDQALALAKKLNPASKAAQEAQKTKPADAGADDKAADKAARAAMQTKEKDREQAEAKLDMKAPVEIPKPENLREEFDQLRYEMACETLALALEISTNPYGKDAALRMQLLMRAGELNNSPRWRYQRALRDRIEAAKRAPFVPFQGTWKTDWGDLVLTQNATVVAGSVGDARIQGVLDSKELTVKGTYQKGQEVGTFEWKLAQDEHSFEGTLKNPRAQPPADVPFKGALAAAGETK